MKLNLGASFLAGIILLSAGLVKTLSAQQGISNLDRDRAESMLRTIRDEVKKHYYDASYHGIDLDGRYEEYQNRIKEAKSLDAAFTAIAAYLEPLHDSHTYFLPPSRPARFDYGFRMQMIGDLPYIVEVRPGSDAATKLHPGDQILKLGRFAVNRKDYSDLNYFIYQLAPQGGIALDLSDPAGKERHEEVKTKFIVGKRMLDLTLMNGGIDIFNIIQQEEAAVHLLRQRQAEQDGTMIWKLPEFDLSDHDVDQMMDKARKHSTLILDLRGNPGGRVPTLERMVGDVMPRDVTISTRVSRKPEKPQIAKTRGKDAFIGKLIVLVDSGSASAAELFARTIQLEHRGTVVGDRTAGAVMESLFYPEHMGQDIEVFYGIAITDATLIMADGKSLEGEGVTPDVTVLPTGADLAAGLDPALAKAAELAGIKLDAAAAGKLFPFEWAPL
ncbi:MAG TPA: S41 family peptidase [Candidatus Acidoferrales bacterium]|nr:S41 family peptidase [Candidatus Acidoferrales bacterium]